MDKSLAYSAFEMQMLRAFSLSEILISDFSRGPVGELFDNSAFRKLGYNAVYRAFSSARKQTLAYFFGSEGIVVLV